MQPFHLLGRSTPSTGSTRALPCCASAEADPTSSRQHRWVTACAARLAVLRPGDDMDALVALAAELWEDLGAHDPEIAAEMEHESGRDE